MRRVLVLIVIAGCLLAVGSKEIRMGAGWEQYGQSAGYTQQQWNNLTQQQRDRIKANTGTNVGLVGSLAGIQGSPGGVYPATNVDYPTIDAMFKEGPAYQTASLVDDGSGGTGGTGTYEAPKVLAESPEWLAYLNALGLEEEQFRSDIDRTKGLYGAEKDRQLQDLPAGYMQQRRGISGSLETRGMSRSGEFLRKLAENRAAQGRAEGAVQGQYAFQLGSLESQLAQKMIDINARKAQQELSLRSQGYQ